MTAYRRSFLAIECLKVAGYGVKLAAFAIRAEYERIAANGADPDLLSLGFTYSF
jgi:hypothetical protein